MEMKGKAIVQLAVLGTMLLAPMVAQGQSDHRPELLVSAGITTLTSKSAQLHEGGAHAEGAVLLRTALPGANYVRLDASYHSLPGKAFTTQNVPDAGLVVLSASAVQQLLIHSAVRPYVMAGVGMYNMDQGGGRESHFGVTGGFGLRSPLGKIGGFVESRFHHVYTGAPNDFIPLSLGLSL
jgi:hypothetical protein